MSWVAAPNRFTPDTLPPPVGGLNVYDPLMAMPPTDAFILQNWWPQTFGVAVRNGYIEWATGMPGTVETLAGWYDNLGNNKMFAWSGANMYDVSSRAAVGAAIVTLLTNARWQAVTLTNAAANHMIAVNGADNGIIYNSGGVARITAGDGIVANTWAGLNPVNAVQLTVHQKRLWATEINSSRGWYLPPDAIQGTFVAFDFGPQFSKGGFLQYLTTWTIDDGNGAEDHLVAVSSRGEAVVYSGTDPNDSTKWGLVGVYYVGSPVSGRRSYAKVGGDLFILTQRGVVSLTDLMVSTRVENRDTPVRSKKIQSLLADLTGQYSALNGWQLVYHAPINMCLVAVPSIVSGGNIQLASNLITNAWTQFVGMDGACWISHNDQLYFGDFTGRVLQAWTGTSDNVLLDNTGGEGITTAVQQAYNYFDSRATQKQVGVFSPVFMTGGEVSFSAAIVYDFGDKDIPSPSAPPVPLGSLWGTGRWGSAFWSGGSSVSRKWIGAEGMGVCASIKMITLSDSDVLWASTDLSLVKGSGIF